jgi:hypothetical protein
MGARATIQAPEAIEQEKSSLDYSLEITPTFTAQEDPYALDTGDKRTPVLTVKLNGSTILERYNDVERGESIQLEKVTGLVRGWNEFHIEASTSGSEYSRARALRFRLFQGLNPVLERTLWAAPGERLSGAIPYGIELEPGKEPDHE